MPKEIPRKEPGRETRGHADSRSDVDTEQRRCPEAHLADLARIARELGCTVRELREDLYELD